VGVLFGSVKSLDASVPYGSNRSGKYADPVIGEPFLHGSVATVISQHIPITSSAIKHTKFLWGLND
jgi:hypothetical protein